MRSLFFRRCSLTGLQVSLFCVSLCASPLSATSGWTAYIGSLGVMSAQAERPQAADPYELLDQIGQAVQVIEEEYYEPADQGKMLEGALQGMLSGLDPHSSYFSREDRKIFEGSTAGRFGGIGVEVEFSDGEIVIIAPIEGSPADRAAIQPGDRIVALDGKPLRGVKPQDVVRLMRGKLGTKLTLSIINKKDGALRDVQVVREEIEVASVRSQLMLGGIAYFRIKAFQEGTHQEFLDALGEMRQQAGELHGIILDLRNNPGGLVREATGVADEFLTGGMIYSTRHRGRILRSATAHVSGAYRRGPLIVLINEYSASAAELVAGALKDRGRAQVIGARSFGKGSVQTVLNLGHGGALKLTTALYYTPSGETTQAQGVTPHLEINPGYVEGREVLKESDLDGHLKDESQETTSDSEHGAKRGALPSNDELHLGVARSIPEDPSKSADRALRKAYLLLSGEKSAKKSLLPNRRTQGTGGS